MKKYLLSTLAVAGILACSTIASASEVLPGPYVVGEAGWAIGMDNMDDAGIFGLGMGYHVNDFMRADVTVGYRPFGKVKFRGEESKKSDIWSLPVMANIYAKYPIHRMFDIYGMGGIGMAWNKTDSITNAKGKTKSNFAWTVGAGIDYYINDCWSLDLGYRYTDLGTARVKGNDQFVGQSKEDVRSNDIKLSARYYF